MEKGGIELGKGGRALDLEREVRGGRRGTEVGEDYSDNSFDALNLAAPSFLCTAGLLLPWAFVGWAKHVGPLLDIPCVPKSEWF